MKILINLFLIVLIVLSFSSSSKSTVLAHIPLDSSGANSKEEPIFVENHQISWAAYNQLDNAGDVDYYSFQAEQELEINKIIQISFLNHSPEHLTGGGSNFRLQLQKQELIIWQFFQHKKTRVNIPLLLAVKKFGK